MFRQVQQEHIHMQS